MVIQNHGSAPDRLLKVQSSAAIMNEVHETRMVGDVMTMSPVTSLEVPANGQVELKSGGYHVMMMKMMQTVQVGDPVSLTLTFEKAGDITVTVAVHN
jgi:copper(I)-binding protein